ncbi:hypothetical protein LQF12_06895 [Ruania suaedae]|uniref:hypothetical protein n=1 Tax=Ruania suaedae TaxID=2897774 RepID=UPI001E48E804|nr:hypothetical protein [Ruania suaedae]UFU04299.1 hypothetical protein LQF12_06895 [Ruania suaedae]
MSPSGRLAAAAAGAAGTTAASVLLRRSGVLGERWERTNYRDRRVSLRGGTAAAAGCVLAAAAAPSGTLPRLGAVLATAAGGGFGALDDLDPQPGAARGLRGHLRALAHGRLTTGALKLLGISGCAVVSAALLTGGGRRGAAHRPSPLARVLDVVSSGALIAGTANLINLFDLRPGRGVKVVTLASAPLLGRPDTGGALAAAAAAVAAASAPGDLRERTMLGDTGANALGALLGSALATHPRAAVRTGALAVVVGLILASERVSFSAVIAGSPALRAVDDWGRLR